MMILTVFSVGATVAALLIADLQKRRADEWRETAEKAGMDAQKWRELAENAEISAKEAEIWLADEKKCRRTLENRLQCAELAAREANRHANAARDALAGERDKCAQLRRLLAETREMLDEERRARENDEREIRNIMNYDGTAASQEAFHEE